jgi:mitogen-activated protein kinase 1/3
MLQGNCDMPIRRWPLFPGQSCFPLSPPSMADSIHELAYPWIETDQLNVIFQTIGTPTPDQIEFIEDPEVITYLNHFRQRSARNLRDQYPASDADMLNLIQSMIQFDPASRPSISQIVRNEIFDSVRDSTWEVTLESPIVFEWDTIESTDLERSKQLLFTEIYKHDQKVIVI